MATDSFFFRDEFQRIKRGSIYYLLFWYERDEKCNFVVICDIALRVSGRRCWNQENEKSSSVIVRWISHPLWTTDKNPPLLNHPPCSSCQFFPSFGSQHSRKLKSRNFSMRSGFLCFLSEFFEWWSWFKIKLDSCNSGLMNIFLRLTIMYDVLTYCSIMEKIVFKM